MGMQAAKKKKRLNNDAKWGYVFVLVPILSFIIFTLYPVVQAAIVSFQTYKPLKTEFVGFANYSNTLKNGLFFKSIWNTVVYTAVTVPVSILVAFIISILLVPFKKRSQSFFKAVFYLPGIASGVALSFVWKWIFDPLPSGLLNSVIRSFGIQNQNWLGSSQTAMLSLIIMTIFSGIGPTVIIYVAALLGIDPTYYEVANIDGATFLQRIKYVVWPMVKPTTVFLTITGVINAFQTFQTAFLMTGGGPDNATTMVGLLIFNNAFKYFNYGEACAQALLLAGIIAVFAVFQFKVMAADVEY
ncbi:carbohydrate ABC transporter permease [Lacrimispora saccharolytica]|uniref:Binding-protein-dependent transport systems inner membrane component n=1 Tax=Lacrimispora saccharolytica (strain ATCC 35040 / DSM 2544 / NRCC 2533 / WM1) TaxID=610130 RepID=D9RAT2_LACSW|nr:sugar ABC transporter permease [Lacrimispora saccharolytica]ADL06129.1 binding-protein-dependent transport systems inner membrane component [[Clostridium] saccharolyticum WM1]QRV19757.1 sugar ABC transporter permease [Lacrimispora saccharolytica]